MRDVYECPECGLQWWPTSDEYKNQRCSHRITDANREQVASYPDDPAREKATTRTLTDDEVEALKARTLGGSAHEPAAPPTVRRYPVWIYFIGYIGETPKGRVFGNQVLRVPAPIVSQQSVQLVEKLLKKKVREVAGKGPRLVGSEAEVIITSVTLLDEIEVEETVTEEGAEGDSPSAVEEMGAGQPTES